MERYRDRAEGGRIVAEHLGHLRGTQPLILGLAGGGVVVAAQVATSLGGAFEVAVAERFGPPGNPDLTVGAVASDGIPVVDGDLVARLGLGLPDLAGEIAQGAAAARRRARALRPRRALRPAGRVVVVVDDGVAAGLGLRAVLGMARRARPARLVCAAPVGLPSAIDLIAAEADEVACPLQPLRFHTVAEWYDEFPDVPDEQVAALLRGRALR
jgi:predicted phosphoribosyltransferase